MRGTDEEARFTGEFKSPKDAEKRDRHREAQARESERTDRPRGSVSINPREPRDPLERQARIREVRDTRRMLGTTELRIWFFDYVMMTMLLWMTILKCSEVGEMWQYVGLNKAG